MGTAAQFLPLILLVVLMYFLLIRPQKKREKQTTEMRNSVRVGDEVVTIGGICGKIVKTKDDTLVIEVGADKVGINSGAIARPEVIGEIADRFGSQVIVLSLDVKRSQRMPSGFVVTTHGGKRETDLDALAWCREAVDRGAGELLVNSMDADGTLAGFDLELTRAVRAVAEVPLIASGGAGKLEHFGPAVEAGADAVLAASVFHDGTFTVGEVKAALADAGHLVRL